MKKKWWLIFIVLAAFLSVLAFLLYAPAPPLITPVPNSYADLVKAGEGLTGNAPRQETGIEEMRAYVEANRAALAQSNQALTNECALPAGRDALSMHDKMTLKKLAQARAVEAHLLDLEGHVTEAAFYSVTNIHFGQMLARNGVLIEWAVASACEKIGRVPLAAAADRLDANTCREISRRLVEMEAGRETWERIEQFEEAWMKQHVRQNWKEWEMWKEVIRDILDRESTATMAEYKAKYHQQIVEHRKLALRLAARAYELEKGKPAINITELIPAYLPQKLINPTNGATLPLDDLDQNRQ